MLHYYLQKGIVPEVILGLDEVGKSFYYTSMMLAIEEQNERAGFGGD